MFCTCTGSRHDPLHCIVPPYMLERLAESGDARLRRLARQSIETSAEERAVRRTLTGLPGMAARMAPSPKRHRLVYDAQGQSPANLPGKLARAEGDPASKDVAVNEAYIHSGTTYDFYRKLFARQSLDDKGMTLISSVHLGRKYNNAFWNGQQMAYGDGDGEIFVRFTKSLDVVGHELTHGVIAHECNLEYQGQSGALNEHLADVFGTLVRQWRRRQAPKTADWLIGKDIMGPATRAKALRDMGPGRAYENDPLLGSDPQPKHMRDLYKGSADYGGVHINSGIPNHAFYLFARSVPGKAWETPGALWYEAMRKLSSRSQFADMVHTTEMIAVQRNGKGSVVHKALMNAWKAVGL